MSHFNCYVCKGLLLFAFILSTNALASETNYTGLAKALSFVNEQGLVDYAGLKQSRTELDAFVKEIAALDAKAVSSWPEKDQLAFWINAYNALTLQTVISAYPNIKKGVFFPAGIRTISKAWSRKHDVAGRRLTIPDIEHKVLRKDFNNANIHLAIVCAALSCPPLRNEPFVGSRLDEQFAGQLKNFIAIGKAITIDRAKNKVRVSKIFKWFGKDFKKYVTVKDGFAHLQGSKRAVMAFLHGGVEGDDKAYLKDSSYDVSYMGYDWSLNEQKKK